MKRLILLGLLLSSLGLIIGCQSSQPPSGDPLQLAWGATIYRLQCARCHEPGRVAPVLTEERLVRYDNAQKLFDYTRETMPLDKPSALPEQDYWDVTAYLLANANLLYIPKQTALGPNVATQADFLP